MESYGIGVYIRPLVIPQLVCYSGSSFTSGGGNYETGFTDQVLAWSPEMEEWQAVGNMIAARYMVSLATCCMQGMVSGNTLSARYMVSLAT